MRFGKDVPKTKVGTAIVRHETGTAFVCVDDDEAEGYLHDKGYVQFSCGHDRIHIHFSDRGGSRNLALTNDQVKAVALAALKALQMQAEYDPR